MKIPMPRPHPFATAPAAKGRARTVPKVRATVYGYARASTGGQSVDAQARHLRAAGAGKVFREVASGAKTDRAQLRRVIDQLEAGDVLLVTRLDRLARSTRDLLNTLAAITDRKAGFRSLTDTWADTTTSHGRLMLTVLAGLAEFERDLIRARTVAELVQAVRLQKGITPCSASKANPPHSGIDRLCYKNGPFVSCGLIGQTSCTIVKFLYRRAVGLPFSENPDRD
jgi:hypothetical protein